MANVIVAAFAIALILGAALMLTSAALSSASSVSISWDEMAKRKDDISRTELTLITADIAGSGEDIDISMRNTGQTTLANFSEWDVVMRYYATSNNQDLNIAWLTYVTSPTPVHQEWTVEGIYTNASTKDAEVYEPNIFNPGEEMIVRLNITPEIPVDTDNVATIGTANGISLAAPFSR